MLYPIGGVVGSSCGGGRVVVVVGGGGGGGAVAGCTMLVMVVSAVLEVVGLMMLVGMAIEAEVQPVIFVLHLALNNGVHITVKVGANQIRVDIVREVVAGVVDGWL